jgi:hypothetical protein
MKAAILAILALSAISVAAAVTINGFTDTACATMAANPVLGLENPSIATLNSCAKSYKIGSQQTYVKYTVCSATAATSQIYTDDKCTACVGGTCAPVNDVPGKCTLTNDADMDPVKSYKITCASASTATITFVSVVAAALAVSLF